MGWSTGAWPGNGGQFTLMIRFVQMAKHIGPVKIAVVIGLFAPKHMPKWFQTPSIFILQHA